MLVICSVSGMISYTNMRRRLAQPSPGTNVRAASPTMRDLRQRKTAKQETTTEICWQTGFSKREKKPLVCQMLPAVSPAVPTPLRTPSRVTSSAKNCIGKSEVVPVQSQRWCGCSRSSFPGRFLFFGWFSLALLAVQLGTGCHAGLPNCTTNCLEKAGLNLWSTAML